jgi:hypothetical protein
MKQLDMCSSGRWALPKQAEPKYLLVCSKAFISEQKSLFGELLPKL